ncbi:Exodeoxyribonuclease I subunit C [Halopseudomonas xinjiangensis]|uniref:Exodeoxyribonuclease I n=1 Tax=Halopseudomonas xinjiangensis TaxID=487184 RepID=A0A1H1N4L7_9GAMM|nr:exodeoxyribonuclease I [Halopseudomonas xinjiangensis]SDR93818.1 Exodeoxyribonuclease I subunit C [Halopseudomonas xinjiangensis]
MDKSIFWYDFESTGIDPRCDRPLQVAGVRTNEQLEEIGEPLCIDCRLAEDTLPAPMACLVTGIDPQRVMRGLPEAEFIRRLHDEMAAAGTCTVGYNNLRFDDEMTRFSLYRNFYNPYAREWQGGNSRWDLLDALRTAHALRPDGINWPQQDGFTSLRLELLTEANGIAHGQAHDALADVRATIAMARLLRQAQPRLYEYLYALRSKQKVCELIDLQSVRPLVHVSGRFGRERHGLAVVLPLGWHPTNRNALIVWDLACDPALLIDLSADEIRSRLYTRREELPEGHERPGLKLVHINKCPVLADTKVLREEDVKRLDLDMPSLFTRAEQLASWRALGQPHLRAIFEADAERSRESSNDCDTQLYEGFVSDADNRLLPAIREAEGRLLTAQHWPLRDQRLADLLFRYRARNFPESLGSAEREQWQVFCRERLEGKRPGAPITLSEFYQEVARLSPTLGDAQRQLLEDWKNYAGGLAAKLGIDVTETVTEAH